MYFRFSNIPATFQSIMNDILGDLIHIRLVIVYLDDILIFETCLKKHRQLVKEVLKRLQFNDFYTKAKCHDLAKQLSHFLFFFCFVLFYLVRSLLRWSIGKYHVTVTKSDIGHISVMSHKVTTCDEVDT